MRVKYKFQIKSIPDDTQRHFNIFDQQKCIQFGYSIPGTTGILRNVSREDIGFLTSDDFKRKLISGFDSHAQQLLTSKLRYESCIHDCQSSIQLRLI